MDDKPFYNIKETMKILGDKSDDFVKGCVERGELKTVGGQITRESIIALIGLKAFDDIVHREENEKTPEEIDSIKKIKQAKLEADEAVAISTEVIKKNNAIIAMNESNKIRDLPDILLAKEKALNDRDLGLDNRWQSLEKWNKELEEYKQEQDARKVELDNKDYSLTEYEKKINTDELTKIADADKYHTNKLSEADIYFTNKTQEADNYYTAKVSEVQASADKILADANSKAADIINKANQAKSDANKTVDSIKYLANRIPNDYQSLNNDAKVVQDWHDMILKYNSIDKIKELFVNKPKANLEYIEALDSLMETLFSLGDAYRKINFPVIDVPVDIHLPESSSPIRPKRISMDNFNGKN
jgi:hypothetical protein